jgi:glucose-6-phosphate isomerase
LSIKKIEDVYAVKAGVGKVVIVPQGYGHVAINPARKELRVANWISEKCQNSYNLSEKKRGACYYYTRAGWIKNKNYKIVPKLRLESPLKKMPKSLDFLK